MLNLSYFCAYEHLWVDGYVCVCRTWMSLHTLTGLAHSRWRSFTHIESSVTVCLISSRANVASFPMEKYVIVCTRYS